MNARDELLDALAAERHNGGGWSTPPKHWNAPSAGERDDELTTARRRRELVEDWDAMHDDGDEEVAQ